MPNIRHILLGAVTIIAVSTFFAFVGLAQQEQSR